METGGTRVYVVPRSGGGWQLREIPNGPVLSGTSTKREAVVRAAVMLEDGRGGEVVVLGSDGAVQRTLAVRPARRPWWYVRSGTVRWLVLVVLGAQLALRLVGLRPTTSGLILTTCLVVLFVGALVVVLRSRALDRARVPLEDGD